jgi:hypothetical protein
MLSESMLSDNEEFDFNQDDPDSLIDFSGINMQSSNSFGNKDEDTLANMQHFSQPPLRSRPAMDFSRRQSNTFGLMPPTNVSGRQSTIGSDFGYSATLFSQPCSQASGSTLHSNLKPEPLFPHKPSYFDVANLPPAIISALTVTQLYHNHHYREIRQRLDDVTATLTKYVERDLSQPQVQASSINTAPPAIYQSVLCLPLVAPSTLLTQSP